MRQIASWKLEIGWVFRSDHLAEGYHVPDTSGRPMIVIDPARAVAAAHDPSRSQALYAVEEKEGSTCDHTFGCCYFLDMTAHRLAPNGTLDPSGERIPKDSYHWYAKIIASNGAALGDEARLAHGLDFSSEHAAALDALRAAAPAA